MRTNTNRREFKTKRASKTDSKNQNSEQVISEEYIHTKIERLLKRLQTNGKNGNIQKKLQNIQTQTTGKIILNDGTILEGSFEEGVLHGPGKKTLLDGTVLQGMFVNGFLDGHGKKTLPTGVIFEGKFERDALNGTGKKIIDKNTHSAGTFVNDMLNGEGYRKYFEHLEESDPNSPIMTILIKSEYGLFVDDELHGEGQLDESATVNSNYSKAYRNHMWWSRMNKFNENKTILKTVKEEKKFRGVFKNGKFNGFGTQYLINTFFFEGQFVDNEPANGTLFNKDGVIIKGEIKNLKLDGFGKYFSKEYVSEGFFDNGILNGNGKKYFKNHTEVGEFQNGAFIKGKLTRLESFPMSSKEAKKPKNMFVQPHGFQNEPEVKKAVGNFKSLGVLTGSGIIYTQVGEIIEGTFVSGKLVGPARRVKRSGSVEFSEFENQHQQFPIEIIHRNGVCEIKNG